MSYPYTGYNPRNVYRREMDKPYGYHQAMFGDEVSTVTTNNVPVTAEGLTAFIFGLASLESVKGACGVSYTTLNTIAGEFNSLLVKNFIPVSIIMPGSFIIMITPYIPALAKNAAFVSSLNAIMAKYDAIVASVIKCTGSDIPNIAGTRFTVQSNTGKYIAAGIGVAVCLGLVYLYTKRK